MNNAQPQETPNGPSDNYTAMLAAFSPHKWTVVGQWFPGGANFIPGIVPSDVAIAASSNDAVVMHRHSAAIITIEARIMGPAMTKFVNQGGRR